LPAGRTVLHQHDRTRTVHLLLAGALQIYVRVGDDDLLVAVLGDQGVLATPASAARTPASGAPRGRYRPWWMTSIISGTVVRLMRGRPCLTPEVIS